MSPGRALAGPSRQLRARAPGTHSKHPEAQALSPHWQAGRFPEDLLSTPALGSREGKGGGYVGARSPILTTCLSRGSLVFYSLAPYTHLSLTRPTTFPDVELAGTLGEGVVCAKCSKGGVHHSRA